MLIVYLFIGFESGGIDQVILICLFNGISRGELLVLAGHREMRSGRRET